MRILGVRSVRTSLLVLFVASSLAAFGQSGSVSAPPTDQSAQVSQSKPKMSLQQEPDDLKQELDADAMALSKIPADPLINSDPLASVFQPVNKLTDAIAELERLKFGATYTFLTSTRRSHRVASVTINSADALISPAPGLLTIMEARQGPSACWYVLGATSG